MKRLIAIAFSVGMMTAGLTACDKGSEAGKAGSTEAKPAPTGAVGQPAVGQPAGKPAPAAPAAHAAADVKPGSHEDWCGEHAVPESLCTRCNPALVPAFQATGDWCPEHGLPESQCLKCNPDLTIVRPPKAE